MWKLWLSVKHEDWNPVETHGDWVHQNGKPLGSVPTWLCRRKISASFLWYSYLSRTSGSGGIFTPFLPCEKISGVFCTSRIGVSSVSCHNNWGPQFYIGDCKPPVRELVHLAIKTATVPSDPFFQLLLLPEPLEDLLRPVETWWNETWSWLKHFPNITTYCDSICVLLLPRILGDRLLHICSPVFTSLFPEAYTITWKVAPRTIRTFLLQKNWKTYNFEPKKSPQLKRSKSSEPNLHDFRFHVNSLYCS